MKGRCFMEKDLITLTPENLHEELKKKFRYWETDPEGMKEAYALVKKLFPEETWLEEYQKYR